MRSSAREEPPKNTHIRIRSASSRRVYASARALLHDQRPNANVSQKTMAASGFAEFVDPDNSCQMGWIVACDRCSSGPSPAKLPVHTAISTQ
jgi:hypothetical protein